MSRSHSSTGKCQNCKVEHHDLGSNLGPRDLTVVCEFNMSGLPLHLKQKNQITYEE
jgi:hypothetical protein